MSFSFAIFVCPSVYSLRTSDFIFINFDGLKGGPLKFVGILKFWIRLENYNGRNAYSQNFQYIKCTKWSDTLYVCSQPKQPRTVWVRMSHTPVNVDKELNFRMMKYPLGFKVSVQMTTQGGMHGSRGGQILSLILQVNQRLEANSKSGRR